MTGLRFDKLASTGGGLVNQLGPVEDVICFFKLIEYSAKSSLDERGKLIIFDRLYKRYLRIEETPDAVKAMKIVESCFSHVPTSDVDWMTHGFGKRPTSFKLDTPTLADVTAHYLVHFSEYSESAIYSSNVAEQKFYKPVKISRSDFGSLDRENRRPLEEYDTLDSPPFWLAGA